MGGGTGAVTAPGSIGLSGRRLGPYRIAQKIGEGGMGVVHLALTDDGHAVAVKVLRPHVAGDPQARERLAREVDSLRRIRHPRVAEVLDADVDCDTPYLVTRYVPASPLDDVVRENGPLTGLDLARLGQGLGEALAAIHDAGVVHRDLKPGNVLMLDGDPVVIDFGIAHVADDIRLTSTGLVMGTPGYLSPELVEGEAVADATDWWGWAATMTFAATGRPPFGRGPLEVVLDRVRRGAADVEGAPAALVPVLTAGLAANPASRPRPGALRRAVQQLRDDTLAEGARSDAPTEVVRPAPAPVLPTEVVVQPAPPTEVVVPPAPATEVVVPPKPPVPPTEVVPVHRVNPETRVLPVRPPPHTVQQYPVQPYAAQPQQVQPYAAQPQQVRPYPVQQQPAPRPYAPAPNPYRSPLMPAQAVRPAPQQLQPLHGDVPLAAPHRSGRSGTLAAGLVALMAGSTVLPVVTLLVAASASVVARAVDRSHGMLLRRRYERGSRRGDLPLAVVAAPWHLFVAILWSFPLLVLPLLVSVSTVFLAGLVVDISGSAIGQTTPLALGAAAGAMTAWWGPGGSSLRRGSRSVTRAVSPGANGAAVAVPLLLSIAGGLLVLLMMWQWAPLWYPLQQAPLSDGAAVELPCFVPRVTGCS